MELPDILADLDAESADLDRLVDTLAPDQWALVTPAPGWTIAHQIAHLAWTDQASALAITNPAEFTAQLIASLANPESFVEDGVVAFLGEPATLLDRWRAGRVALRRALAAVPPGIKIPWYGTAMSAISMVTARIMETWAHGLDVADTLGVVRAPTARLRHIAHLGYRTLGHGFLTHDRAAPTVPVHLQLTAPDSTQWTFGPPEAADIVSGPAEDFCLLVTQRRHRADLKLATVGPVAAAWLDVAQAFAGPPGAGRRPTTVSA